MIRILLAQYTVLLVTIISCNLAFADQEMEQCKVVDKDGNNLIKEYRADSGLNLENDDNAWIWVPVGVCAKLNSGNYAGISPEILDKIHPSYNTEAQTIE